VLPNKSPQKTTKRTQLEQLTPLFAANLPKQPCGSKPKSVRIGATPGGAPPAATFPNGPAPHRHPQPNTKNYRTNPNRTANWFIYNKDAKIAAPNEPNLFVRIP
jgi:hypothetical protein